MIARLPRWPLPRPPAMTRCHHFDAPCHDLHIIDAPDKRLAVRDVRARYAHSRPPLPRHTRHYASLSRRPTIVATRSIAPLIIVHENGFSPPSMIVVRRDVRR